MDDIGRIKVSDYRYVLAKHMPYYVNALLCRSAHNKSAKLKIG